MKTRFLTLTVLAAAMVAACDRIDPTEYTIPTGQDREWNGQRVYIEKYTGPKCSNCPAADRTLEAAHEVYGDRVVVVSVNSMTDQFGAPMTGYPDMRTSVGAEWETYWGVSNFPTAYIGRRSGTQYTGAMSNIVGGIEQVVWQEPKVGVEVEALLNGNEVAIDVDVEVLQAIEGDVNLSLIVTEDSLAYWQLDGSAPNAEYVHNHMLRDVVGGTWGTALGLEGTAGERKSLSRTYTVTNDDIKPLNCHIVALVTDAATKEVLNCAECRVQ